MIFDDTLPKADTEKFNPEQVRQDFPILNQLVRNKPLVYLDNAATTQKPNAVIQAIQHYYQNDNANVHRGVHCLSERATIQYEGARQRVAAFIKAKLPQNIIFTRGTTEAINLVASGFAKDQLKEGDEIIISHMEHHSNIVPWQMACQQSGATLKVIPIFDNGSLDLEAYQNLLSEKTKVVAVNHVSNALGTINPIKQMTQMAHQVGAVMLVDGAQAAHHQIVDVQDLECDFYAFSGHKLYGPTGIGVLYGKEQQFERLSPYQGGGEMITQVSFEKTTYAEVPHKFEAGTPNIAGAIGLSAAIDYIERLGLAKVHQYEADLLTIATERLSEVPGLKLVGTAEHKTSVISFVLEDVHPHDIATIVDSEGVAIRAGHHCAMPLMNRLGLTASCRASIGLYNTMSDFERLAVALNKAREMFA